MDVDRWDCLRHELTMHTVALRDMLDAKVCELGNKEGRNALPRRSIRFCDRLDVEDGDKRR